ncbi:hypothetical protein BC940DRAFT_252882 [Gongronella butleri]|nr:hypothetical protein BC940DRAFT_252882 [Gongronella butleri]
MKSKKQDTSENDTIKTQIDQSMSIAHALIESWLPPDTDDGDNKEKDDDMAQQSLYDKFSKGRPDRLGLGAKFLSHNEAARATGILTKQQTLLKNKILNQNQRKRGQRDDPDPATQTDTSKKRGKEDKADDDDDDDEAKHSSKKTKRAMGGQGDFLSMYLSERSNKKKKKKK